MLGAGGGLEDMTINAEHLSGNVIGLDPSLEGKLSEHVYVKDVILIGGSQALDGIYWQDTVFVGMHIRYNNGETALKGVHFVNCTFDFSPGALSADLADTIAGEPAVASKRLPAGPKRPS
jgi:hypothetical protein